jgi:hypothetical protein
LEPSGDERQSTKRVAGNRAREAKLGPSAQAVIEIAGDAF